LLRLSDANPKREKEQNACRVSYARRSKTPSSAISTRARPYGHVKLLTLVSLLVPRISPLSSLGTRALAQHCNATLLMRSASSSFNLSCLFASLLLRSFTPLCSTCVAFANGIEGRSVPSSAAHALAEPKWATKLSFQDSRTQQ
jgi:hypothetical protein